MSETTEPVAGLEARYAALRQAARSEGGDPGDVLEAAFTELEGAIDLLRAAAPVRRDEPSGAPADNAERGLLRAVFQDAPVPLFLVARDGTVQRVNRAAGDLIGAKPGYATGRPFTAFVALPSRAAVNSQLTAVGRTGKPRQIRCSLVAGDGLVPCELVIGRVGVKGNPDESDPLLIAVRDAPAVPVPDAETKAKPQLGAVQAITRRLDLVTAVARLLLENEGYSESRTLQRCARLIARELTAWVIVDMDRRHRMRRQFVGRPGRPAADRADQRARRGRPAAGLGPVHRARVRAPGPGGARRGRRRPRRQDLDGEPLLTRLDATSLLSVPLTDGEIRYGVLTLARRASDGHFKVADLALVQELGEQMGLAIRVDRMFRRRSDTADALHASLQPRKWPDIPGVQIAATYLAATEDADVGGDFYDVYRTPDGWGLAVGDVCGKGEEAAAVTAAARHAIRVLARRCADPGEVLAGTNEIVLAEELALDGGFVTASIAHLAWQDDTLRVVLGSAGHPAAAVLRSDGAGPDGQRRRPAARAVPRRRARHPGAGHGRRRHPVPLHRRGGPGPRPGQHLLPGPAGRRAGRAGRPGARGGGGADAPGDERLHRGAPGRRRHDAGDAGRPGGRPGRSAGPAPGVVATARVSRRYCHLGTDQAPCASDR